MEIGIMGGTFDPIHNGHIAIARAAFDQFDLDAVWFLPNGKPPHKKAASVIADSRDRRNMVALAIQDEPGFVLNEYEANRETVSYSYETLAHFHDVYPSDSFHFIVGADSLFQIESWMHPEILLKECSLLAAVRTEAGTPEELRRQIQYIQTKYESEIRLIHTRAVNVSSHEIRNRIKHHKSIHGMVPPKVETYILEGKLYEEGYSKAT